MTDFFRKSQEFRYNSINHVLMNRQSYLHRAFRKRDVSMVKNAHTDSSIRHALHHPDEHQGTGKYLRDAVYGALDGIVTTFAIVSGVVGAELSPNIILILGFANLFADGFSMATGNYLSLKSEQDYHREEYNREKWEVENYPKGEKEEIRQIYQAKGFTGKDLESAVKIITSDKERWINTMMVEELGIIVDQKSPFTAGLVTFLAFLICGALPLVTFILIAYYPAIQPHSFLTSCIITGMAIFTVGSLRSLIIAKHWLLAGMEMLLVSGTAAAVAYFIGYFLKGLA